MKKLLALLAVMSVGLFSCTKDSVRRDCNAEEETATDAVAIYTGTFQFFAKSGTGKATVYRKAAGALTLGLEGMSLSNNTRFKIMAAASEKGTGVKLFSIARLNGTVFYDLPAQFDLSLYKYILIQTEPSEEVVASAELH